ncbi:MAG: hypothetical protein GY679_02055 [Mycoplasma sp.]|nr:hypothetical protein [Mycoplasma sp.]
MTKEQIKEIQEEYEAAKEQEIKLNAQIEISYKRLSGKEFTTVIDAEKYIKQQQKKKVKLEQQLKEQIERLENEYIWDRRWH